MRMRKWLYVSNNVMLKRVNSKMSGWLLLLIMACSLPATASVVAERTRVIFSEGNTDWLTAIATRWRYRFGWMTVI